MNRKRKCGETELEGIKVYMASRESSMLGLSHMNGATVSGIMVQLGI
jgi:hypothetical protein